MSKEEFFTRLRAYLTQRQTMLEGLLENWNQ